MDTLKIVHVSDLHISEHLLRQPDAHFQLPHRYGHNVQVFLALDSFLNKNDWDLLVITGDLSRIGNAESFEWTRNWLENIINIGNTQLGLNLSMSETKRFVVIPGNHDRFNGETTQGSLEKYHQEFPVVRVGSVKNYKIRNFCVNIHFYDSTYEKGGFARGLIEEKYLVPKNLSKNAIDIAVLHHHFIQPPKHHREIATELDNSSQVAAYLLNVGFDAIMFGHTHKSYIGEPKIKVLTGLLNDKRKISRFLRRMLPKWALRLIENDALLSYDRVPSKNGQLPTMDTYFDYLYFKQAGYNLKGPQEFDNIKSFYEYMNNTAPTSEGLKEEIEKLKEKKVLISLAPSACQAEARWNGFHVINFCPVESGEWKTSWDRFEFNGNAFVKLDRDKHQC